MQPRQLSLYSNEDFGPAVPRLNVRGADDLLDVEREQVARAGLSDSAPVEAWQAIGTNRQLSYATHGVFRFFGKFPPPIPRHLISEYSAPQDWVLDPMLGSGTSAVEAVLLGRHFVGRDVSPLSLLLAQTKTTWIAEEEALAVLARTAELYHSLAPAAPPDSLRQLRNAEHWFLPETIDSLARLRAAVDTEPAGPVHNLLRTAFASTVRRVSRATTQQGRLFLDVVTAEKEAWPVFEKRYRQYAKAVAGISITRDFELSLSLADARAVPTDGRKFKLVIVHPPYFNNYKYSSINSLELAWLGIEQKALRSSEIREAFKIGKPEKVAEYVSDLSDVVVSLSRQLARGGRLALMMGDTVIRGEYIDVTKQLLSHLAARNAAVRLEKFVLRVPQYTEASWVASQRRKAGQVGVSLNDFILLLYNEA